MISQIAQSPFSPTRTDQFFTHHFRPPLKQIRTSGNPDPHPLEPSLHPPSLDQLRSESQLPPSSHSTQLASIQEDQNVSTSSNKPEKPKRAYTLPTMSAQAADKATLPIPKNLLFIDHDVPASGQASAVTTPTDPSHADPLAAIGAGLNPPAPATNGATSPPLPAPVGRVGKIGHQETKLPDVHAEPHEYYGGAEVWTRARTFSNAGVAGTTKRRPPQMGDEVTASAPRRFLIDVEETMRIVLEQEDTDRNFQISIYDSGPKLLSLGTASSNAHKTFDIRVSACFLSTSLTCQGTYMLSNLLQELALARDYGRKRIVLDEARLAENPVDRLSRMIKNSFWNALTRRIDAEGLEVACADPKNRSQHMRSRIYIPHGEDEMAEYYRQIKVDANGKVKLEALPFVVPGARFNEKYGWDSYFMALGLLVDGRMDLAKSIVEHCLFEIKYYNKVLNGNRSYYLCRSQPPFLTDLALQIYNQLDRSQKEENKNWLKRVVQAAIKEYHSYWMSEPSLDPVSGLSRYRPVGLGIPPETEASHFTHILQPYAQKLGISVNEYIDGYNELKIHEPELDEYFLHDRGVRESGHDTSYRLDRKCADLGTVDLNSLLYKYEFDIASAIEVAFDGQLDIEEEFDLSPWPITPEAFQEGAPRQKSTAAPTTSKHWFDRAARRKDIMDELCWNDGHGMYFDYDTKAKKQARYESVTTLWPLWAGCASEEQALKLVRNALPKFEVAGGLVSGTEESRGIISLDRPNRQWDYPYSWPPHQIMAWVGLERYGFVDDAARLAYRWIYMMTLSFVDFNGIVPEKFDAVELSHMVDAEYGNQGTDFRYVPREGFGWMNSAYQIGLQCLSTGMRRAVANCVPPWVFFNLPAPDFPSARRRRAEREAREAEAAASGHGGQPKKEVHHEPPSLEEAIAQLKIELGAPQ
ncbi:hypothetical protein IAT40_007001 [Kwoniella sp. CBS 6097]